MIQTEFEHLNQEIYLDTAAYGAAAKRSQVALLETMKQEMNPYYLDYAEWSQIPQKSSEQIGQLLGTKSENISHHTSVGEINSLVALGFPFEPGDVVVGFKNEYPSDVLPWMLNADFRNYQLEMLDRNLLNKPEELEAALPKQTRILSLSLTSFNSGDEVDLTKLKQILDKKNIFLVVDASQTFGGRPLRKQELECCDVISCVTYKWLLGAYGHAFAYWSDRALNLIERRMANWMVSPRSQHAGSLCDYSLEVLPGARKFDRGQAPNMLTMSVLSSALEFIKELGLDTIEEINGSLKEHFLQGLEGSSFKPVLSADRMFQIFSLKSTEVDSAQMAKELLKNKIKVSVREGNLRVGIHFYNTPEQLDKLLSFLKK